MNNSYIDDPFEGEEQYKTITVTISQTLSSTQKIQLPIDVDEDNPMILEQAVEEQIMLPSDCVEHMGYTDWIVDDFCIL